MPPTRGDGGEFERLATTEFAPDLVASDCSNVYFAHADGTEILWAPLAGGNHQLLAEPSDGRTVSRIVATAGGIYWVETAWDTGMVRALQAPGGPEWVVADHQSQPSRIAVGGTHVYWTTREEPSTTPPSGGGIPRNVAGPDADPANVEHVTTGGDPGALALDAEHVYWMERSEQLVAIRRVPKSGLGTAEAVVTIAGATNVPDVLLVDDAHLFWVQDGDVHRSDKTPGSSPQILLDDPNLFASWIAIDRARLYLVATDGTSSPIYWTSK